MNFQITSLLIYSQISYIIYMYMYCIFILNKARQLRFFSFMCSGITVQCLLVRTKVECTTGP